MQPSSPIKSAGWKRPSKSKIYGKIVRGMIWNPLSFEAPEAVRLQAGESSMQCLHCQSVCSGRDSWSPISQNIWELQQKALSPVNTKKRRTEHCKGCVTPDSTLVLCHPETSWCGSSPWVHPNQYQFQGDCAQELTPALWSLHVQLQRCSCALCKTALSHESCCFHYSPNVKRTRVVFLSQTQRLKLYNPDSSVKGIKQLW